MNREPGYYRVKVNGEWTFGSWEPPHWRVYGWDVIYEEHLQEIDTTKIDPNSQSPVRETPWHLEVAIFSFVHDCLKEKYPSAKNIASGIMHLLSPPITSAYSKEEDKK